MKRERKDNDSPEKPLNLKATVIRMLARREYGRAELTQRLLQRGIAEDLIDPVLDQMVALGFLSDARYAEALVRQKQGRYAKRAIAHVLKERGLDRDTAAEALAPLEAVDEQAEALALWKRRFGEPPKDDRERNRQIRFLLSRGYSTAVAFKVLKTVRADLSEDSEL